MDIVLTTFEKLGGSIEIESELGVGTTMRLKMPPTLSVIGALIVSIDGVQYAVPEINVERIVRIQRGSTSKRLERIKNSLVLNLGGRIIPVVTMDEIDAKAARAAPPDTEAALKECEGRGVVKCLVMRTGDRSFALLIDDAVETVQTLVKPLPAFLKDCSVYSNVTVLGNGAAIMILDAEGIMRLMEIKAADFADQSEGTGADMADERQIIIFKCSGTEYYAVETGEISRIEAIEPASIQEIGTGRFVNIAGKTIRVIRPEDYAPVKKGRYNDETLYLLTLKSSKSPIGLLSRRVIDKVEGEFALDTDRVCGDFISGTSVYDEKILVFLKPSAIAEEVEREKQRKTARKKVPKV
jgi:two-component system chemotaxis sensor kinase CheA